jgi:formate C-acetyltransferase
MPLTYEDRLNLLRETKLRQTREKLAQRRYMDGDDHGCIAVVDGFRFEPVANRPDGAFGGAEGWGLNFRRLFEMHPTYVDPVDALAGRWMVHLGSYRPFGWPPELDYPHLREEQERYGIISGIGAAQHFGSNRRIGLELGWDGLLAKIRHYRSVHGPEKHEFYDAEENVVLGIQSWIRCHIEAIREAERRETRPELLANLREMAEANEWIVGNPPRTLREACQWIAWFHMASRTYNGDGAGDQLDELLRPYYERDVAEGRIDDEDAIFILACLLLNDPQYYQIGGPAPDGRDQTSRISFLILEAAHRMGTPCNLTIRVYDGLDSELYTKAVRHLLEDGKGWPRFSGDTGLTEGFMRAGYSAELARRRIAVGCHWMAIPGIEYTMNDCVKINAAKVFDVAFWDVMKGDPSARSTSELWRIYEGHMRRAVLCTAQGIDFHLAHQKDNHPELLINLLCEGPIEKGLDASDGGVELYNMCVDGSGLATAADSFGALEQRIETERVLTWDAIAEHLRTDYQGPGGERVRLMMKTAGRYGFGGSPGDAWAVRISRMFTEAVRERPTPGGRPMIPGWFSWSSTIPMGKVVPATPNGRRAWAPISHGANPDPGFRKDVGLSFHSARLRQHRAHPARARPGAGPRRRGG